MAKSLGAELLRGILEADETYYGPKPGKRSNNDNNQHRRGRGTSKTSVIGVVERGGKVVAQVAENLDARSVLAFIKKTVDPEGSQLFTDGFKGYSSVKKYIPHSVILHSPKKVQGTVHTNTIEGFWSLFKRAWYGSYHHYTKRHAPLYIAEACYTYNHRNMNPALAVNAFLRGCFP